MLLVHSEIYYVPVLLPSHPLQVHNIFHYVPVTSPPHQQPFSRTFKKSTAPYKVHNLGLRYIITINVPVVFMAQYVMVLRGATSLLGALEGVGPENQDFFEP